MWEVLGCLGASVGGLGLTNVQNMAEAKYVYFFSGSAICGLGGRSWAALGSMWPVLAALGAYVGGLGPLSGPMLAVLGHLGAEVVGLGPKGSTLGGDQGRKVAANPSQKAIRPGRGPILPPQGPEAHYGFIV